MHINTHPPCKLFIPTLEIALCINHIEESPHMPENEGSLCAAALFCLEEERVVLDGETWNSEKSTVLKLGHYMF